MQVPARRRPRDEGVVEVVEVHRLDGDDRGAAEVVEVEDVRPVPLPRQRAPFLGVEHRPVVGCLVLQPRAAVLIYLLPQHRGSHFEQCKAGECGLLRLRGLWLEAVVHHWCAVQQQRRAVLHAQALR